MKNNPQRVADAAGYLAARLDKRPSIGLLTGTGLAESADWLKDSIQIEYREIPHFPLSTVQSHLGRLRVGDVQGRTVMAMLGRFHLYEGYSPAEVTFPVRVMQQLGIDTLIVTNAAGGLNREFEAGDIMLIADHINLTGANPLVGPNEDNWGIRFPDMSRAYDPTLRKLARSVARRAGLGLRRGVYAGLKGPSLETPAEVRFLQTIGADAVGFSTVQEVIAAVHAGMRVLGFATITNINNPDRPQPASVEEIIAVAAHTAPVLGKLINTILTQINASEIS